MRLVALVIAGGTFSIGHETMSGGGVTSLGAAEFVVAAGGGRAQQARIDSMLAIGLGLALEGIRSLFAG